MHGSGLGQVEQDLWEPARQMRWRVPELTLLLSDRLAAQARLAGDRQARLRAETLAVFASNRLGRSVAVTERAIAATRDATTGRANAADESLPELRVELACCARVAGSDDTALRLLAPVLEQDRLAPSLRAHALVELSAALPADRRDSEREEAYEEADRLYSASVDDEDTARLLRARVWAFRAGHHRRQGASVDAVRAAETGLDLLDAMGDPDTDSGEVRSQLVLEQVHGLFDGGERDAALDAADELARQPVRAASAMSVGWLRLALATRAHLPAGDHATAVRLLAEAAADADRHHCGELHAEALGILSQVYERTAEYESALRCLRDAYGADRRWRNAVYTARVRVLEEFPGFAVLESVPAQAARRADPEPAPAEPDGPQTWDVTPEVPDQFTPPTVEGSAREAARRLMETFTGRAASTGSDGPESEQFDVAPSRDEDLLPDGVGFPEARIPDDSPSTRHDDGPAPEDTWAEPEADEPLADEPVTDEPLAFPSFAEQFLSYLPEGEPPQDPDPSFPAFDFPPRAEPDEWRLPPSDDDEPELHDVEPDEEAPAEPVGDWLGTSALDFEDEPGGRRRADPARGRPWFLPPESSAPEAQFPPEPERPVVPDSNADRVDVTAIMPVVPSPTHDEEADRTAPAAYEDLTPPGQAGDEWAPRMPEYSSDWPVAAPAAHDPDPANAEPDHESRHAEPGEGRRSRGRSLAEIRAGLRVVQEPPASGTGGRRRRRAEPDDEADDSAGPRYDAAEPAARSDEAESTREPVERALRAVDSDRARHAETGLADLLAEALVAYEDGRRGEDSGRRERRETAQRHHAGSDVSGITPSSAGRSGSVSRRSRWAAEGDGSSAARARHRHDGPDQQPWTPRTT